MKRLIWCFAIIAIICYCKNNLAARDLILPNMLFSIAAEQEEEGIIALKIYFSSPEKLKDITSIMLYSPENQIKLKLSPNDFNRVLNIKNRYYLNLYKENVFKSGIYFLKIMYKNGTRATDSTLWTYRKTSMPEQIFLKDLCLNWRTDKQAVCYVVQLYDEERNCMETSPVLFKTFDMCTYYLKSKRLIDGNRYYVRLRAYDLFFNVTMTGCSALESWSVRLQETNS